MSNGLLRWLQEIWVAQSIQGVDITVDLWLINDELWDQQCCSGNRNGNRRAHMHIFRFGNCQSHQLGKIVPVWTPVRDQENISCLQWTPDWWLSLFIAASEKRVISKNSLWACIEESRRLRMNTEYGISVSYTLRNCWCKLQPYSSRFLGSSVWFIKTSLWAVPLKLSFELEKYPSPKGLSNLFVCLGDRPINPTVT